MSFSTRILHHGPKPISVAEFRDAVESVCPPRFRGVRHARPRRIAMAISGGVDSMAMAYLFSSLIKTDRAISIADNPVKGAFAIIIDHKLRQESSSEASQVAQQVRDMGLRAIIKPLSWKSFAPQGQDPRSLSNIESIARTLRYRMLGSTCRALNANSLFLAHHRDDQYETVLMRYMSGHAYRGCQGIREANAIPECHDLHGVYKSGLLDDQIQSRPFLNFKMSNRELRHLRCMMKRDFEDETCEESESCVHVNDALARCFPEPVVRDAGPRLPYLAPLDCEDGGVMIYRPLLQFDKDRLVATCLANNIQWFEDPTNADASLTRRNAIRHMDRSTLPDELQKDVILDMAREAKRRTQREESESRRWLMRQAAVVDFDPNAGTLLAELPPFQAVRPQRRGRLFARARAARRRAHQRLIAAIVVRKLIEFVTPDTNAPPVSSLDKATDRLFPDLASGGSRHDAPPKAFTIGGVSFEPTTGPAPTQWFLSRAPYPSTKPLPEQRLTRRGNCRISPRPASTGEPTGRGHRWRMWKTAKLWDGRYWIRLSACVPATFTILPLVPQHARPFRKALPPEQRTRLEQLLKHHAPGKTRYSLPALYSVETRGGKDASPTLTLLALPSLGIQLPGLDRWVKCEARYRWVDGSLLAGSREARRGRLPAAGENPRTTSVAAARKQPARSTRPGRGVLVTKRHRPTLRTPSLAL